MYDSMKSELNFTDTWKEESIGEQGRQFLLAAFICEIKIAMETNTVKHL
jgi:hypothetical protein